MVHAVCVLEWFVLIKAKRWKPLPKKNRQMIQA